jgi:hypothetical protein
MKLRAVYWLAAAFVINFFAVGSFILGEYYTRLCGISFPYAASHFSRLAILAQRGDAQALLSRARCVSSKGTSRWADDSAGPQGHLQRISLNII